MIFLFNMLLPVFPMPDLSLAPLPLHANPVSVALDSEVPVGTTLNRLSNVFTDVK